MKRGWAEQQVSTMKYMKNLLLFLMLISTFFSYYCGSAYKRSPSKSVEYNEKKYSKRDYYKKKGKRSSREGEDTRKKSSSRMIIYRADYSIRVDNVEQAIKGIDEIKSKFNGFIESSVTSDSYRYARVVLRVPVKSFDMALKMIDKLGDVIDREIKASDVTMEFQDVSLRVNTAKLVRARLYDLLKRTNKVKDRVKILREIERLTTLIDSLAARLNFLKNRADFSTIFITLRARVRRLVTRYLPSPFKWIAGLTPNRRSIFDDGGYIKYKNPKGFYHQRSEYYKNRCNCYLFTTPADTIGLRIGVVKNYPPADLTFWNEAFELDIKNRKYKILSKRDFKNHHGLNFKIYDIKINDIVYSISFAVAGDKILILEAKFTSMKYYKSGNKYLNDFIMSVRRD
ncbi:DUF4349 domain-containing protein [Spirochaetota bacterium]